MKLRQLAVVGFFTAVTLNADATSVRRDADLDQNWSEADRTAWYDATQGSRLLPLSWFRALEQPKGGAPFADDRYIAAFRYLPRPGRLPVGFAVDDSDDQLLSVTRLRWKGDQSATEPWLGLNCSACHTAEVNFAGTPLRIDGGPTLADFQGFTEALDAALRATLEDPKRFARFAVKVLGAQDSAQNRDLLRSALGTLVSWDAEIERMNKMSVRYGFGRLDAFGHIFNKVALAVGADDQIPNPSDAPVSYPFLWNVPQQDRVQWNGIAPNRVLPSISVSQPFDIGALGRNAGEVIGVFADFKPSASAGLKGYTSSVRVSSLVSMEQLLDRLRPPKWPAMMGSPDVPLVAKGRQLFDAKCRDCHADLDRTDLAKPIAVRMVMLRDDPANRTDPWMACNAYLDQARTGVLEGTPRSYVTGAALAAEAPLADMLATSVEGVLVGEKGEVIKSATLSFFGRQPPPHVAGLEPPATEQAPLPGRNQRLARCLTEQSGVLGYKARPLTGIWATGPYLHNGSVPTLHDLLLPPDKRPRSFWTGSRTFDAKNVGFVTTKGNGNDFLFEARDADGHMIDGNSNAGHDYGASLLSEQDRDALVEYLKTL